MEVKERHLKLIGAVLFAQFYVVWALGFANYVPQLYNFEVLRASAMLLVIGLLMMLSGYIKDMAKRAAADKYFRALMIIYFAAVYYIVYSVMMAYYQLGLGVSLDTAFTCSPLRLQRCTTGSSTALQNQRSSTTTLRLYSS